MKTMSSCCNHSLLYIYVSFIYLFYLSTLGVFKFSFLDHKYALDMTASFLNIVNEARMPQFTHDAPWLLHFRTFPS